MICWHDQAAIPKGVADLLSGASPSSDDALDYADRFQLTLMLDLEAPRVEVARAWNLERNARLVERLREILDAISGRYDIVVLKGFTHSNLFHVKQIDRISYDLDLFSAEYSKDIRIILERFSPNPYIWKGNFYDPEMPIHVDYHDRLWDEWMEGLPAPGVEDFWARRVWMEMEGLRFQTLAPPDALAFAALHMLKHIFHGDARPAHAFEIASFLRHHEHDDRFWGEWRALHPPELRRLQGIAFRFAAEWFGCPLPEEGARLPPRIERWFERFAASPITSFFRPNKDELALNLCLIDGRLAKARVAARRLFPVKWPRPFSYALARGAFHLRALAPAVSTMFKMRR